MCWRRLHAAAVTHRFQIAVLPGCDKPDPGLEPFSTVGAEDRNRMWAYFTEGGADNMGRLLRYAEALIDGAEKPESAAPLMKAGIWWPGQGVIGVEAWKKAAGFGAFGEMGGMRPGNESVPSRSNLVTGEGLHPPTVALCFYRALVQSGETKPRRSFDRGARCRRDDGAAGIRVPA